MDEAFKIDLFLLPDDEYSRMELSRAQTIKIGEDHQIKICSPEDVILAKLRWFRLGNQVSDRQWNDIVQVLEVQNNLLDDAYLNRWADHFNVLPLLVTASEQSNRV